MPHSAPDWSSLRTAIIYPRRQDLAELAARLGSIVSFDRRGDVVFLEDFADGLERWSQYGDGLGRDAYLSLGAIRSGHLAAKLIAGSDGQHFMYLRHWEPYPVLGPMGLEIGWGSGSGQEEIAVRLEVYDGSTLRAGEVKYRLAQADLQYLDASGNYVTFASGLSLQSGLGAFHAFKLVVDPAAGMYVRFRVDHRDYDLSGISLYSAASAWPAAARLQFGLVGTAGVNGYAWFDNVIYTVNEPV